MLDKDTISKQKARYEEDKENFHRCLTRAREIADDSEEFRACIDKAVDYLEGNCNC